MKAKEVVRACAVYLVMGACACSTNDSDAASGNADGQAMPDALANPMPVATAPNVAYEKCDKMVASTASGPQYYAEHLYPGKSAAELALVQVVVRFVAAPNFPTGYSMRVTDTFVRDGAVAAMACDNDGSMVTFVLP